MSSRGTSSSSVLDFYSGASVLVTGASGFLGKVIVEKLLRVVGDIDTVYLLIRPQNGLNPQQRLEKLLKSDVFSPLKAKRGEDWVQRRLVAVGGNLMEKELGLSSDDRQRLCRHVNVVFHCAATVKFDEQLRISVEMNVLGTQRLVAICRDMDNLKVLVHASTAYANCDRRRILEAVYPPPIEPQRLIDAMEWMNDDMVETLTPQLLGRRPNTYTLTKALAEHALTSGSGAAAADLPLVIVRPSIIGACWKEPLAGWMENLNGPNGIFAGASKGILTNMRGNAAAKADIIPVDVVADVMIAAGWWRATRLSAAGEQSAAGGEHAAAVVNCCSGRLNPVRWQRVLDVVRTYCEQYPLANIYRLPVAQLNQSQLAYKVNVFFRNWLPAYIIDLFRRLSGRKPRYARLYKKVLKFMTTLHYFSCREWDFQSKAMLDIWDQMSPEDQKIFPFDIRELDWNDYLFNYQLGVRKFILNDDINKVDTARKRLNILRTLDLCLRTIGLWGAIQLLARRQTLVRKWLMLLTGLTLSEMYNLVSRVGRDALPPLTDSRLRIGVS